MRVSIIPESGQVYVDGVCRHVDLSWVDASVHAVQWDGEAGEIELKRGAGNEPITELGPYAQAVDLWTAAAPVAVEQTLDQLKAALKFRVNSQAEIARHKYLTPGAGQIFTYQEKYKQADAVEDMGPEAANSLTLDQAALQFPTLAASIGIEGPTLWDCAMRVIQKYEAFSELSGLIERKRLVGLKAISDASDAVSARAAYEAITWTDLP